jgi:AraC-like DNA-binding protein
MAIHYELLDAGYTPCGREWGSSGPYACYMLYYLQAGRSRLEIAGRDYHFKPGLIYFFSGYHLGRYSCESMSVRWIHINPTSFALTYALKQAAPVHCWEKDIPDYWQDILGGIDHQVLTTSTLPTQLKLHAFIQDILSRATGSVDQPFDAEKKIYRQLAPAIAFMDQHYQQCPSLEAVSQVAAVAPNYFHCLFKQYCGMTPYQYMLNKRMSLAQHLLLASDLPIKSIARKVGYPCPFHFAKIFHQYFGQSPSQRRTQNLPFFTGKY